MKTQSLLKVTFLFLLLYGVDFHSFSQTTTYSQSNNVCWLENGVIKVGLHLQKGGSITHLMALTGNYANINIINFHDLGREIQPDYYSGPNPCCNPNLRNPNAPADAGYNPLQAGDSFGNPSTILDYNFTNGTLYVKTRPKIWSYNNIDSEATLESWYNLIGKNVHIRYKITYQRTDQTVYSGQPQAIPAIYTNKPFNRFFTYDGPNPFTSETISQKPSSGGTNTTEQWSALVNSDNFGVGLYQINSPLIGWNRFNEDQGTGETDNATNLMQPLLTLNIGPNTVLDYEVDLVVGSVADIRQFAYDKNNVSCSLSISASNSSSSPSCGGSVNLSANCSNCSSGGGSTGPNIVTNGDFTNGNTGFSSEYVAQNGSIFDGSYGVATNMSDLLGWTNSCSARGGSGKMLLFWGSSTSNKKLWSQTVTVSQNTTYQISFWARPQYNNSNGASFTISVNNSTVTSNMTFTNPNGFTSCSDWQQFTGTFNSGSNTSVTIAIIANNAGDTQLDDISVNSQGGGSSQATYAWAGPNSFSSTQQNPTVTVPSSSGAYTYTLTVSNGSCTQTATTSITVSCSSTATCTNGVDLSVVTDGTRDPSVNGTVRYAVLVQNNGASSATNVKVKIKLPTGVSFDASGSDAVFSYSTGVISWDISSISASQQILAWYNLQVNQAGHYNNRVFITQADQCDPNTANNVGEKDFWTPGLSSDPNIVQFPNPSGGARMASSEEIPMDSKSFSMDVSPNPTSGRVVVRIKSFDAQPINITLVNSQGLILKTSAVQNPLPDNQLLLDFEPFLPGLYLIYGETKDKKVTKKIIKY
ncbi:MAG: T9SS type A sorting domain-containing protein [Spirosomataceae bacterium]